MRSTLFSSILVGKDLEKENPPLANVKPHTAVVCEDGRSSSQQTQRGEVAIGPH